MPSLRASLACALLLLACNQERVPAEPEPTAPAKVEPAATPHQTFGAALPAKAATRLSDVLSAPDKYADQSVLVEGAVRRACTRKGCWMELAEAQDAAAPGCRVTFKDYGFFVPTDSAGSRAKVEARVETRVLKPSLVAHLEEEGAKFQEKAADGSAREVRLVASGVELWR